jgi:hypothetical protein
MGHNAGHKSEKEKPIGKKFSVYTRESDNKRREKRAKDISNRAKRN